MRGLAAWVAALLLASQAAAADISLLQSQALPLSEIDRGRCTISLKGRIEPDDAERLRRVLDAPTMIAGHATSDFDHEAQDPDTHAICLTSDGGDFDAAVELVKVVHSKSLVTIVPKGAECLSACAFVFLAGTLGEAESENGSGSATPYRVLDASARLGFHAPSPEVADPMRQQPMGLSAEYFRNAIQALRDLSASLTRRDTYRRDLRLPSELLIEILSRYGSDQFYEIETLDDAARYGIRLTGLQQVQLDWDDLFRLCENAIYARSTRRPTDGPDLRGINYFINKPHLDPSRPLEPGSLDKALASDGKVELSDCTVERRSLPGDDFRIAFAGEEQGEVRIARAEDWHALPYYVRLKSIAGEGVVSRQETDTRFISGVTMAHDEARRSIPTLAPGYTFFGAPYEPGENSVEPTLAFELGPRGAGRLRKPDGGVQPLTYKLRGSQFCITLSDAPRPSCGQMARDTWTVFTVKFDQTSLGWLQLNYARPGLLLTQAEGRR